MERQKMVLDCGVCRRAFQFGPGRYDGKYIALYELTVCKTCWDGNWDGWSPEAEIVIQKHLEVKGLEVPLRNEKGWLPRG